MLTSILIPGRLSDTNLTDTTRTPRPLFNDEHLVLTWSNRTLIGATH